MNHSNGPAVAILRSVPVFMRSLFHDFDAASVGPDLNRTQLKALIMLHHGMNTTMSMLSRMLDIEKGSTTSLVDALERKELVGRFRDSGDRRTIRLKLTEAGAEQAGRAEELIRRHINRKLSVLRPEEKDRLLDAISVFDHVAERIADV